MQQLIGNRYQIVDLQADRIGRGGMGDVYRATDRQTGKPVAIKHLRPELIAVDVNTVERFAREGEALRRLNHPNIVLMLDAIEAEGEHYLVMEYVPGGSLRDLIAEQGALPVERVLKIGIELADALTRAHHLNIIHRDIKPANVLLAADGTPRLTDFGVAHVDDLDRITDNGLLTGTYAYLSPEACSGIFLDGRADIWSFGVVLYEMLCGRRPFEEPQLAATLTAILSKPVPDLAQFRPDAPETLANLIFRMLEKDRSRRISSARLVGAQLEAIIDGHDAMSITGGLRFADTPAQEPTPVLGPRHNLPRQPTAFIGRAEEVADLVATLRQPDCRLLTLVGPGGMGKTRLALAAAEQLVETYRHGVRFVPLAPILAPELIVTAVADALNFTFPNQDDPAGQLLAYLREKEMLLLMDNFEHVIEGADFVADILAEAGGIQILVTSREALNLWEEWPRPVPGMRFPATADTAVPSNLETYSAVRLFADRARRLRGGFDLEAEWAHVVRICQLVGGMPLGIELAATWLRMMSPEQIAAQIEADYDFLTTRLRNIPERHRSLRAVFEYSWQLLTAEEQRVFRRLAVFQGGLTQAAAAQVAGASLPVLTTLVNKSLLAEGNTAVTDTTPGIGQLRYTLHELLKQYALEKLQADEAEAAAASSAHAAYFCRFLQAQEPALKGGRRQKEAFAAITADLDNIRAGWQWCVAHLPQGLPHLQATAESLYVFLDNRGQYVEGIDMLGQAATAVRTLPQTDETRHLLSRLLTRCAILLWRTSQHEESQAAFTDGLAIATQLSQAYPPDSAIGRDVRHDQVLVAAYRTNYVYRQANHDTAREALLAAETMAREIDDKWGLLRVLNIHGNITSIFEERTTMYREGLRLAKEIGDEISQAMIMQNLANFAADVAEAEPLVAESVAIYERLQNAVGLAFSYHLLSSMAGRGGRYLEAKTYGLKSLAIFADIGSVFYLIPLSIDHAEICWALGELDEAEEYFKRALELVTQTGDPEQMVRAGNLLGQFWLKTAVNDADARYQEARRMYKAGLALLPQIQTPQMRAEALDSLGNFALALGEYSQAKAHFEEAARLFETTGDASGVAWAMRNFGLIAYGLGDYETAAVKLEESLQRHQEIGRAYAVMELHSDLGRVAFAAGNDAGAALCYRQALTTPQNPWTVVTRLKVIVDWSHLLLKQGAREQAFTYLTVAARHPLLVPPRDHRIYAKTNRLLAELEASLAPEWVAEVRLKSRRRSIDEVAAELVRLELETAVAWPGTYR